MTLAMVHEKNRHVMTLVDPCVVCGKNRHAMILAVVHEKKTHAMTLAMVHEKNTHAMTLVDPCVVCKKNRHAITLDAFMCRLFRRTHMQ